MQTARRRRTTWAIAASALAHMAVLLLALLYRPHLTTPMELAAAPPETVIPVFMTPRSHLSRASAPHAAVTPLTRAAPAQTPPGALPLSSMSSQAAVSQGSAPAAGARDGDGPPAPDVRAALRHGAAGCASLAVTGMSRADRERCEAQLAAGAKTDPVLTIALDPRIRAYYDAVAKAKAPDKPLTPLRATGALGMFDGANYGTTGRPAGFGCHLTWGPGEKKKLPSHWLKLGPCFIAPPQGPLTVEADITPPDQDRSHPVEHTPLPQQSPGVRRTAASSNSVPNSVSASAAALGASTPAADADGHAPRL